MITFLVIFGLLALHEPAPPPGGSRDVCRCAAAEETDGRCLKCDVRFVFGQRLKSDRLYEVIDTHGHEVHADRTACAACRDLIARGGFCDACNMGYIAGKGFYARLGYHMGLGRPRDEAGMKAACANARDAWCTDCREGFAGNRRFVKKDDFEAAMRQVAILKAAIDKAATCEPCAAAMVSDGRCHVCAIAYKAGQAVNAAADAPAGGGEKK